METGSSGFWEWVLALCVYDFFFLGWGESDRFDQGEEREIKEDVLSLVAMMIVTAEPSSIENPREGECSVIRLPRLRMML